MSASATEVRSATLGGVVGALLLGALAGAGLTGAGFAVIQLIVQPNELVLIMPIFVIPVAFVIWGAGLLIIGGPSWLLLHLLGVRSGRAAMICGAVLAPLGAVLGYAGLNNGAQSPGVRALNVQNAAEWLPLIAVVAVFGMAGALVGRVVATAAYGREGAVR